MVYGFLNITGLDSSRSQLFQLLRWLMQSDEEASDLIILTMHVRNKSDEGIVDHVRKHTDLFLHCGYEPGVNRFIETWVGSDLSLQSCLIDLLDF